MSPRSPRSDEAEPSDPLSIVCEVARWSHGAAAVSVAVVTDGGLRYVASSGEGADEIVGTLLPPGRGLAGFVAATGQSLTVRDAQRDPRFARDVAEGTGYVPDEMHIVPVLDGDGDVAGVVSMLDRHREEPPGDAPFTLADLADVIAPLLPVGEANAAADLIDRLGRLDGAARSAVIDALSSLLDALDR